MTRCDTLTLLHNPHCPTSVHALDALEGAGHTVAVRKYLLVAERLSEDELRSLAERLQGDPPDALIRRDKKYKELGLEADGLGDRARSSRSSSSTRPCCSARSSTTAPP